MDFIVENIRKIRRDKSISQEYLAEKLGYKQDLWSKIENGKVPFPTKKLEDVSTILECDISELVKIPNSLSQVNIEQKGGSAGVIIINNFDQILDEMKMIRNDISKLSNSISKTKENN